MFQGSFKLKDTDMDYLIGTLSGVCPADGGTWYPEGLVTAKDGSVHKMRMLYMIYKTEGIDIEYEQFITMLMPVGGVCVHLYTLSYPIGTNAIRIKLVSSNGQLKLSGSTARHFSAATPQMLNILSYRTEQGDTVGQEKSILVVHSYHPYCCNYEEVSCTDGL